MTETRITLEETNDFATALHVRRLAIGMDLATLRTFLDRSYTSAEIDRWEAGTSEPSTEEKGRDPRLPRPRTKRPSVQVREDRQQRHPAFLPCPLKAPDPHHTKRIRDSCGRIRYRRIPSLHLSDAHRDAQQPPRPPARHARRTPRLEEKTPKRR